MKYKWERRLFWRVPRRAPGASGRRWSLGGVVSAGVLSGALLSLAGCKDLTGGQPPLPVGTPDPSFYNTATGAVEMRNAAVVAFEASLAQFLLDAGLITDELEDPLAGSSAGTILSLNGMISDPLDERILPEGNSYAGSYAMLQGARTLLAQAIGQLATYDTSAANITAAKGLRGELYALEGYSDVFLADLFCSGVPLSTLDFQHDYTYEPGSSTVQVYQAALAKFDTALVLAQDSVRILQLAQVGKGRAWLALGQYDSAAASVGSVPTEYNDTLAVEWGSVQISSTVSDREGGNGLPYLSSGDPRTAAVTVGADCQDPLTIRFPAKYSGGFGGNTCIAGAFYSGVQLASGVEARLIEAEAALQHASATDTTWLQLLNELRATAPVPGTAQPATAQQLPPLADPGIGTGPDSARVALLFAERAAWLFVTGHRQGDLRRLLRQYGSVFKQQSQVYPSGVYGAPGDGVYGTDVTVPIPPSESVNPYFHGCLSRGA